MIQATRRDFLRYTGGMFTLFSAANYDTFGQENELPRAFGNERIKIGVIGVGGQGNGNLRAHIQNTVAVCDVDKGRAESAQAAVKKATGADCAVYGDYRRILDDKSIDAVVISTPDHWHALPAIQACQAGKHVYCEKPLTLFINEGRMLVKAARRNRVVVQCGSQQRSDNNFRLACELVRNGRIGKVHTVRVGLPGVNFKGPSVPDSDPPMVLDYDFWLGPAPRRPYNSKRVHYNFRFFWDYSGGQLTNWGAHHLDIAQWGLGMDESGPTTIEGTARFNADKWYEVPQSFNLTYTYASGIRMLCGQEYKGGTTFEGSDGTIHVTRGSISSNKPEILKAPFGEKDVRLYVSRSHHGNWIECVRTGKLPICDAEIGHRSATVCHLGNIAIKAGKRINWDPVKEVIVGDNEAHAMTAKTYREPWRLPEIK